MNFINIDLTDIQLKNLLTFLNRVEIKGFDEINALNDILKILTKNTNNNEVTTEPMKC